MSCKARKSFFSGTDDNSDTLTHSRSFSVIQVKNYVNHLTLTEAVAKCSGVEI